MNRNTGQAWSSQRRRTTVAEYVERVRAALADLPPEVRDELLEDLPEHLAEVAAESEEPLEARLGTAEAYAAELRATGDLGPPNTPPAGVRLAAAVAAARARLRAADARFGRLLGYERVSTFGRQLRPGWWLLRGYLVAMLVAYLVNPDRSSIGLVPRLGLGADPVGWLVVLAVAVAASLWLGRRSDRLAVAPRLVVAAGSVVLVFLALLGFATADRAKRGPYFYTQYVYNDPYAEVRDLYVYDRDGLPLRDVLLVDQRGMPFVLPGPPEECLPDQGLDMSRYPRCPDRAPLIRDGRTRLVPLPTPSSPLPTPPAAPTPSPTSTG